MSFSHFSIGFDHRDRARLHELWDEIFESNQWSEGQITRLKSLKRQMYGRASFGLLKRRMLHAA